MIGAIALVQPAVAQTSEPANKPAVAINRGQFTFAGPGQTVRILKETVKTSKPTDLLFSVTAESSIITEVTTTGSQTSSADGTIKVFVTVNGQVVHPTGGTGPGHPTQGDTADVVFANQTYRRTTQLGSDDTTDTINTYLKTKHASGFNWAVLNAGSGTHVIEVFARYEQDPANNVGDATAQGIIGNRSLIVQAVKCQVDETVVDNTQDPSTALPVALN